MESWEKLGEAITECVRPLTYPIAVKLLKSETDIPKGIKTARERWGHKIAGPCQAWAMARYNGESLATLKDDMKCPIPVISYGLVEPPEFFLNGDFYVWAGWERNKELGSKMATSMPRFPAGQYTGVVTAPVHKCDFAPDMVMLYCNPLQLLRLIGSAFSMDGKRFEVSLWPLGICTIFVQVEQTGNYQLGVPCYGGRRHDMTSHEEMIFVAPAAKFEDLAYGLKYSQEHGKGFPPKRHLDYEPETVFWKRLREEWEE
jgi:uncharacterized protein (DUF169 family)